MSWHYPVCSDDYTSHTSRIMGHTPVRPRVLSFDAYPLVDLELLPRRGIGTQLPRPGYSRLERIASADETLLGHKPRKFVFTQLLSPIRSPRENHVPDV